MAWQTPKTNWKAGDVLSSEDFNRIEGNTQHLQDTKETPQGAQTKANAALNSAKQYTDQKATTTLNSAKQYTDQVTSMVKPVVGSYIGTGSDIILNLGFRPKLIIVSAVDTDVSKYLLLFAFDGSAEYGHMAFTWDDLRMSEYVIFLTTGAEIDSNFSDTGVKYSYIAFR